MGRTMSFTMPMSGYGPDPRPTRTLYLDPEDEVVVVECGEGTDKCMGHLLGPGTVEICRTHWEGPIVRWFNDVKEAETIDLYALGVRKKGWDE